MGKRNKDGLLWLDSWDEAVEALATTHTISLSQVCKMMQASRPWVNRYIRPHVSAIYISGMPDRDGWPVTWSASRALSKEIKDSIWMDEKKLYEYLESCVVSCTAQTKLVPYAELVPEARRKAFCKKMDDVIDQIKAAYNDKDPAAVDAGWDRVEYLRRTYITGRLERALIDKDTMPSWLGTGRTSVPASPVPRIPVREACKHWHTIADMKGYGGVDEIVYRDLYIHGAHRMELSFDSPQGAGKKIYYYPDPEPCQEAAYSDRVDRGCLLALVRRELYNAWREQET